jgi:CheY-like chemotaxis protein
MSNDDFAIMAQERRGQILYLDDEPKALKYFKSILSDDYDVVTCSTVADALQQLEQENGQFEIVVADDRMPCISGVDFLEIVTLRWPNTARILTTAYADTNRLCQCFNCGQVDRIILKPWVVNDLFKALSESTKQFDNRRTRHKSSNSIIANSLAGMVGNELVGLEMDVASVERIVNSSERTLSSTDLASSVRQIRQRISASRARVDTISDLLSIVGALGPYENCRITTCIEEAMRLSRSSDHVDFNYEIDIEYDHDFLAQFDCVALAFADILVSCQRAVANLEDPKIRITCLCEDKLLSVTFEDNGDSKRFADTDGIALYSESRPTLGMAIVDRLFRSLGARMTFQVPALGGLRTIVKFPV